MEEPTAKDRLWSLAGEAFDCMALTEGSKAGCCMV